MIQRKLCAIEDEPLDSKMSRNDFEIVYGFFCVNWRKYFFQSSHGLRVYHDQLLSFFLGPLFGFTSPVEKAGKL